MEVEGISYIQIIGKGFYALQPSVRNGVGLRADPGCAGRGGHLYIPRLDPGVKERGNTRLSAEAQTAHAQGRASAG